MYAYYQQILFVLAEVMKYVLGPESFRDKFRLRRICTSHFKGWKIYVETLLDYGLYTTEYSAPSLSHINRFTVTYYNLSSHTSVSWLLTAPLW